MSIIPLEVVTFKDSIIWNSETSIVDRVRLLDFFFAPFTIYVSIETYYSTKNSIDHLRSIQIVPEDDTGRYSFFNIPKLQDDYLNDTPHGRRIIVRISSELFGIGKYNILFYVGDAVVQRLEFAVGPHGLIGHDLLRSGGGDAGLSLVVSGTPKSGTTWLEYILNSHSEILVMHEGNFFNFIRDALWLNQCRDIIGSLDWENYIKWRPISPNVKDYAEFIQLSVAREFYQIFSSFISGGVLADRTPGYASRYDSMLAKFPALKIIHIVRHPLDVLVSWTFHEIGICRQNKGAPSIIPASAIMLATLRLDANMGEDGPTPLLGAFGPKDMDSVLDFWLDDQRAADRVAHQFPERVLLVRYEDLQTDFDDAVLRIFDFLGRRLDPQSLASIRVSASFEHMSGGRSKGHADNHSFFRKGVFGDFGRYLNGDQIEYCWSRLGAIAASFGYQDPRENGIS